MVVFFLIGLLVSISSFVTSDKLIYDSEKQQLFERNEGTIFLGKNVSNIEWWKLNAVLDCWASNGKWSDKPADIAQISFTPSCYQVDGHYGGQCAQKYNDKYIWQVKDPSVCGGHKIIDWNHDKMVEILKGKTIMMVGDSITSKFMSTFRSAFEDPMPCILCNSCTGEDEASNVKIKDASGQTLFRVISVRNDYLTVKEPYNQDSNMLPWIPYIDKYHVDILLLNRGAHYQPPYDVLHDLHETFQYLSVHHPQVTVIFRDTYPGHMNANSLFHQPPLPRPQYEEPGAVLPYHWGEFHHMNAMVKSMIRERFPWVLYMDISSFTKLRADGHADGLHYCAYGPPIHWLLMLYNIFHLVLDEKNITMPGVETTSSPPVSKAKF